MENYPKIPSLVPNSPYKSALLDPDFEIAANKDLLFDSSFPLLWRNEEMNSFELFDEENFTHKKKGQTCVNSYLPQDLIGLYQNNERRDSFDLNLNENNACFKDVFSDYKPKDKQKENEECAKKITEHLPDKGSLNYSDCNRFLPKMETIERDMDYNAFGFNLLSSQEKESNILMNDFSLLKNEFLLENSENLLEEKNKKNVLSKKEVCTNENNISFPYQNDSYYEFNNYPPKVNSYTYNNFFMKNENRPLYLNYLNAPKSISSMQNLNDFQYMNQINSKIDEEKFSHENKFNYSKLLSESKNDDFYDMFSQNTDNNLLHPLDYEIKSENKFKNTNQDHPWHDPSDHEEIGPKFSLDAKSIKIKKEQKKSKHIMKTNIPFKEPNKILEEAKIKNQNQNQNLNRKINQEISNEDNIKRKNMEYMTLNRFPQKPMENMNSINSMNRGTYKPYSNYYLDNSNYTYSLQNQPSMQNYPPQNNNISNINYMNNINTVNVGTMNNMMNFKNNEMMNNVISQRNVGNFNNDQNNYNPNYSNIFVNPSKFQAYVKNEEIKDEFGNNNTKKIQQMNSKKNEAELIKTNNLSINNLQSMRNMDLQAIQLALQKKLESRKLQEKDVIAKKSKSQKNKNQEKVKVKAKIDIPFENGSNSPSAHQNFIHPQMKNEDIASKRNFQFPNGNEQRKDYYSETNIKNNKISFPNMPTGDKSIYNKRKFNFNDNSTEHSDLPSQNKIEDINNILNFNVFNEDKNFNMASNSSNVNNIIIMKNIKDVNIINDVNLLKKSKNEADHHHEASANKKKYKHPHQVNSLDPNIKKMQNYQNIWQNPMFLKKMNEYRMRNTPKNYYQSLNYPNANYEMNVNNNNNMNNLNAMNHMNNMNKINSGNNFHSMSNANLNLNNINLGNMNNMKNMNNMNTMNNVTYLNNMGNLNSNNMNIQNNGNNNFKPISQKMLNNSSTMNPVNNINSIHNMNNMNNLNNINYMNNYNSMNYGRFMAEQNNEAEYLKYLNNANGLGNRILKENTKNSESYETLLKLNEERNPLDLAKVGKMNIENNLKIEKSKSINDFNGEFISNENALYPYQLSQKSENSEDHFDQMKMARLFNLKNSLNMGNFRSEQSLENAKANFYKRISSYNNINEKEKTEEKKKLDINSSKKESTKELFLNDQERKNNDYLISKQHSNEKFINNNAQDKLLQELYMEKFKANLKKNSINPGNLKASHQNAEKRINNSDKITCRNSAFEENSLADNALIKFPLHNELSIKKEDFPEPSIPNENLNNAQGAIDSSYNMDKNDKIMIGKLTLEERKKKIEMYLEKRRKRTYSKKISYNCRKNVADKRVRIKGRFVKKIERDNATFMHEDGF